MNKPERVKLSLIIGTFSSINGEKYEGEFKNGAKDGKGIDSYNL